MGKKLFGDSFVENPLPGGNSGAKDDSSAKEKSKQNQDSVISNGNFSFLYDKNIPDCILDIKNDKGLYVTKLSNFNNFYYRSGYNYNANANPNTGISSAVNCTVSNKSLASRLSAAEKAQYGNRQYNYTKLHDGTVLANCVGWCNGRLLEIWHRALQVGYIKAESSSNYVITSNNTEIKGRFNRSAGLWPPNYSASQWWDTWPGNSVESGWYKSQTPQVGAVVCWGIGESMDPPGHVAIVEEIHNPGEPNEELIISHSAYTPHGTMWLVKLDTIYKSTGYKYYDGYKLRGFLISPVCQLASTNLLNLGAIVINAPRSVSDETKDAYKILRNQASGKIIQKDLPIGAKVKIVRRGYKKPEGSTIISDIVNNIGVNGVIDTRLNDKNFPYGVFYEEDSSRPFLGYYDWTGVEIISDENFTTEKINIWWEGSTVNRPNSLTLELKIHGLSSNGKKSITSRSVELNTSNNWSMILEGIPKYTDAGTVTELEWVLPALPTGFKKIREVSINGTTAITIENSIKIMPK